jgi:hypothetical protein
MVSFAVVSLTKYSFVLTVGQPTMALCECGEERSLLLLRQCTMCSGGDTGTRPFYCIVCKVDGCTDKPCTKHTTCWEAHKGTISAERHREIDPLPQLFMNAVTHSDADTTGRRNLHAKGREARWFNVTARTERLVYPELRVRSRFTDLCDPSHSGNRETTSIYPSFVSFIGDTCVGKSTIIRAMILLGKLDKSHLLNLEKASQDEELFEKTAELLEPGKHVPVTRSADRKNFTDPTTYGVHLYKDKAIFSRRKSLQGISRPILFADCEGFGAGQAKTNEQKSQEQDDQQADNRGKSRRPNYSPPGESGTRGNLECEIQITAKCYLQGKDGIDLFYARYLYAISDVIVFVTKEDTKISKELTRVLEWASRAVFRTVNFPTQKTLIIVRNMPESHLPQLYTEEELRKAYLEGHEPLWSDSAVLREFRSSYNRSQELHNRIETNQHLFDVLFQKIVCCYIPHTRHIQGGPVELYDQYKNLRHNIEDGAREGSEIRLKSMMQYNVPTLSHILNVAFRHFAKSERPLDFYVASRQDNPTPHSMSGHIANCFRHVLQADIGDFEKEQLAKDVISLAFQTFTLRNLKTPTAFPPREIWERSLRKLLTEGIANYCRHFEMCTYMFQNGSHCVSRPGIHLQHQSSEGNNVMGLFKPPKNRWWLEFEFSEHIRRKYEAWFETKGDANGPAETFTLGTTTLNKWHVLEWKMSTKKNSRLWEHLRSNKTCFSCLQAVPDHVLACAHSFCARCVQELGTASISYDCAWELSECPLCLRKFDKSQLIKLKPRCAGTRMLTLDGGGIRGIVELSLLKELQDEIGLSLPFGEMFDLIVGTSTGT